MNIDILRLIERSKDIGDGWRQCSQRLWPAITTEAAKLEELVELDKENQRIRITAAGKTLLKWVKR